MSVDDIFKPFHMLPYFNKFRHSFDPVPSGVPMCQVLSRVMETFFSPLIHLFLNKLLGGSIYPTKWVSAYTKEKEGMGINKSEHNFSCIYSLRSSLSGALRPQSLLFRGRPEDVI